MKLINNNSAILNLCRYVLRRTSIWVNSITVLPLGIKEFRLPSDSLSKLSRDCFFKSNRKHLLKSCFILANFVKSQKYLISQKEKIHRSQPTAGEVKKKLIKSTHFHWVYIQHTSRDLSDGSLYLIDKIRKNRTLSSQSRRGELKQRIDSQRIVTIHVNLTCSCLSWYKASAKSYENKLIALIWEYYFLKLWRR